MYWIEDDGGFSAASGAVRALPGSVLFWTAAHLTVSAVTAAGAAIS